MSAKKVTRVWPHQSILFRVILTIITTSVNESTTAISMSARNSNEIVKEMKGVSVAMDNSKNVTSQLSDSTKQFVTY
uniref:hypothetical protein n=1 Tax=Eubacterium cellulosolvens TaxID=29322 RepID=UPI0004878FE1|nr:hypothetical protein [[Eubacterium] cellulosolvens]